MRGWPRNRRAPRRGPGTRLHPARQGVGPCCGSTRRSKSCAAGQPTRRTAQGRSPGRPQPRRRPSGVHGEPEHLEHVADDGTCRTQHRGHEFLLGGSERRREHARHGVTGDGRRSTPSCSASRRVSVRYWRSASALLPSARCASMTSRGGCSRAADQRRPQRARLRWPAGNGRARCTGGRCVRPRAGAAD